MDIDHFPSLTKDFSPGRRRKRNAIGTGRLKVKVEIAEAIGEELLLENDELSGLLCEAELDFSDKELVQAIEKQVADGCRDGSGFHSSTTQAHQRANR